MKRPVAVFAFFVCEIAFSLGSTDSLLGFQDVSIDLDKSTLIESMANRSQVPEGEKPEKNELRTSESIRIGEILDKLGRNVEPFVHLLRDNFDDERFCLRLTAFNERVTNFTIGDVCHDVLGSALSEPYYRRYRGSETKRTYHHICTFFLKMDRKAFKTWLEERDHMTLLELQIDAGKEMMMRFQPHADEAFYVTLIKNIEQDIDSLKKSGKAYVSPWWGLRRFP